MRVGTMIDSLSELTGTEHPVRLDHIDPEAADDWHMRLLASQGGHPDLQPTARRRFSVFVFPGRDLQTSTVRHSGNRSRAVLGRGSPAQATSTDQATQFIERHMRHRQRAQENKDS